MTRHCAICSEALVTRRVGGQYPLQEFECPGCGAMGAITPNGNTVGAVFSGRNERLRRQAAADEELTVDDPTIELDADERGGEA
jgi:hypothetical protein